MEHDSNNKRTYTNFPFEIFVLALTVLPFVILTYFYSALPNRIPLFINLSGEVTEWGEKSVFSVFRVPLIAVVMQVVCFLMKYETMRSQASTPLAPAHATLQERYRSLNTRMWNWLRWTIGFKTTAESLHTILLSITTLSFLSQPTFFTTIIVTLIGALGALLYLYRLLVVDRTMKRQFPNQNARKPIDKQRLYARVFYFNRLDSALFVNKYGFNFANVRAWVLIACAIAYPLLVFLPG